MKTRVKFSTLHLHFNLCIAFYIVLVSNKNMYIDIKPYFCLPYRSILNYWGMRCFPGETFQTRWRGLVVSQNVNKYGRSVFVVSKSYRKWYEILHNFQIL